jgi:hypothetical protein
MKTLLFDHGLTDKILDSIKGLNNTWNSPVLLRSSILSKNNKRPLIGFSQESSPFSQESNDYEYVDRNRKVNRVLSDEDSEVTL